MKVGICHPRSLTVVANGGAAVAEPESSKGLKHTIKLATYFALWYALNVGYNIYNSE